MVKQVLPHARHIRLHFNTQRLQARALAYTREFEQLGRQNRPCAQHHLATGTGLTHPPIAHIAHPHSARTFPHDAHRLRLRAQCQARGNGLAQITMRGAAALAIAGGQLQIANAFIVRAVVVRIGRDTGLQTGLHKSVRQRLRVLGQFGHMNRAIAAAVGGITPWGMLKFLEIRQ